MMRRSWLFAAFQLVASALSACGSSNIPLVMGVDLGTESARVGLFDLEGKMIATHAVPYETYFPAPGWAEQSPADWWVCLGQASRECLSQLREKGSGMYDIVGLCVDTTACSVVALDKDFAPLRRCLLWCDARSAPQCKKVMELARGDPALDVNCAGAGPLSAEWMVPKCLWLKESEPHVWAQAAVICEKQDYINYLLVGEMVASGCNVAARWHWDAELACAAERLLADGPDTDRDRDGGSNGYRDRGGDSDGDSNGARDGGLDRDRDSSRDRDRTAGRPVSLLQRLSLPELLDKWPARVVPMGGCVGSLTEAAAQHLGLVDYCGGSDGDGDGNSVFNGGSVDSVSRNGSGRWRDIRVTQGGPDAYVGILGLGCVHEGQLALITGSSHLHLAVCSGSAARAAGVWGPYNGAPLHGLRFAEGGQSSSGSSLAWFRRLLNAQLSTASPTASSPVVDAEAPVAAAATTTATDGKEKKGRFAALARLRRRFLSRKRAPAPPPVTSTPAAPALSPTPVTYAELDAEAAVLPVGSGGLLAVETFQGSRTPVTDAEARGALIGLTLSHTRGHVWRAMMEAVCYGTRAAVEALTRAGITSGVTQMAVAGGATRSPLWLQMHADVTGLPVVVGEFDNAPLLGAALLAAVGSGRFDDAADNVGAATTGAETDSTGVRGGMSVVESAALRVKVQRAARAMVRERLRVDPEPAARRAYDEVFAVYEQAAAASRELSHALAALGKGSGVDEPSNGDKSNGQSAGTSRSGDNSDNKHATPTPAPTARPTLTPTSPSASPTSTPTSTPASPTDSERLLPSGREALVMPSLLAADFGALAAEAQACLDAGAEWLHVDVCDGSAAAGGALTLGPQAVAAIHRRVPALRLDVHVVSLHTRQLVAALARAGAARLTFQYELLAAPDADDTADTRADLDQGTSNSSINRVLTFARSVRAAGMLCGVCLAPGTSEAVLAPLLREWFAPDDALIDYVDVLAVNPGIGGQTLDPSVLGKVARIHKAYQQTRMGGVGGMGGVGVDGLVGGRSGESGAGAEASRPVLRYLAVDGGIDRHTAQAAAAAGANVLIAGTAIFGKQRIAAATAAEGSSTLRQGMQPLRDALLTFGL